MKVMRGLAVLLLLVVGFAACGGGQQTGSDKVLDFKEQQSGGRLGDATPKPATKTAAPGAARTAAPAARTAAPATRYFDVSLIAGNPYFAPSDKLQALVGTTLRVTNNDKTPERASGRSFSAENGAFSSPLLKPGATWTYTLTQAGTFTIVDHGLNFARATLQVG